MTLIHVPAWGTVSIIEAVWLLSGVVAVVFTLLHLKPLWLDYVAARLVGEPVIVATAWSYFRREVIRFIQAAAILSVGVYAAVTEGLPYVTPAALVFTVALFVISAAVSAQALLDWRTRKLIVDLLAHANGNGGGT